MPFTFAHAAAALPFRRTRLVPSALIIGTFAPDFEYFIRLSPGGGFGHTMLGAVVFTLPVALVVLWLFHRVVKGPAVSLLPRSMQRRTVPYLGKFAFLPSARLALIVLSLLIGIATHILWDSFTHSHTWLYHHWQFLAQPMRLPIVKTMPRFKVFQLGSSILGSLIVLAWLADWFQKSASSTQSLHRQLKPARKLAIVLFGMAIATIGAFVRILPEYRAHTGPLNWKLYLGHAICTWIAVVWWQLVLYGTIVSRHTSLNSQATVVPANPAKLPS